MLRPNLLTLALAGFCLATGPAIAQDTAAGSRQLVLQGAFAEVLERAGDANARPRVATLFDQGLAAFALQDFERAAGLFARVAQSDGDPGLLIRAAIAASLSLSRMGDRDGTCEYTGIVKPLMTGMPLLWRGWIEEARRANNCT